MTHAIPFINWTNEDFTHTWDNKALTFKAGSTTMLPDYLAKHFAKHMAFKIIATKDQFPIFSQTSARYLELYNKCLGSAGIEVKNDLELEIALLNEPKAEVVETTEVVEEPKKHMGRPPKAKVEEPVFEG